MMDAHEIDYSEYLEYIEPATENDSHFVQSAPVVPPWEKKKHWNVWTPFLNEYHNIIDNPRRLPSVLQPLLSKDRPLPVGKNPPSYLSYNLNLTDEYGVHRRLYVNLCQENLIVGAVAGLLVGAGTRHFYFSRGRLQSFIAQRLLTGKPVSAVKKMALTGSILAVSLCGKLFIRAVSAGVLYDVLKRTRAAREKHMDTTKKVINAGLAGGITGLLFGLRGGLPFAWAAGFLTCAGTVASEFVQIPLLVSTDLKD